jgi:copper homeostasis protein
MIRPRSGDFVYSDEEFDRMKKEITIFKTMPVQGVVFGILDSENHLNLSQITDLAAIAHPLQVTIHKAIDQTPDLVSALESLKSVPGISSVLTSGGANSAIKGSATIRSMIAISGNIQIIAAGKVTAQNITRLHQLIGGEEYHGRSITG